MGFTFLLFIAFLSVAHAISGPKVTSATVGRPVTITCRFDPYYSNHQKYWCRGYNRATCHVLVQTHGPMMKSHDGKIKISADNKNGQLTVQMDQLTTNDKGWYWCGIERHHLLDYLSPTELKVTEGQKLFPSDKERLRLFIILGIIFGTLAMMLLGLVILVIKKIRKHKDNDNREKESTIENSIPKSNSVLSKELAEGVTYATVTILPSDRPQEDAPTYDNVKPSNSQEAIKPSVIETPASEPMEYSTIVFKK
uniref:transmembrane domain-containing protein TMIGD3-like n=1 Tax=Pristiophorus japonicus TaxID=55135 RepID=UPI00398EC4D5